MIKLIALFASCFMLFGCNDIRQHPLGEFVQAVSEGPPTCRSADLPASELMIGDIEFPNGLKSAEAGRDEFGRPQLNMTLRSAQIRQFSELTLKYPGELFEIKIDGEVVATPRINDPIFGAGVRISGDFTQQEVEDIARRLSPPCPS